MYKIFTLLFFISLVSCKDIKPQNDTTKLEYTKVIKSDYELYKPTKQIKGVLILFGGFPEVAEDIKREFDILEIAKKNDIAILFSNYNQKLWLEEYEKAALAQQLQDIITTNALPVDNIYLGGFSSGGVISLLISDYITGLKTFYINPKGVFIVDSPIDLAALYTSSEKNIERNFSDVSVQESHWIVTTLGNAFGHPNDTLVNYENNAVFTSQSNNTSNLQQLKSTKIRLYTEPDTLWWKKERMADFEQMNAFYIKKLSERLKAEKFKHIEYIPTTNKGYRANGERHPHSWSIVDKEDLIDWILE